VIAREPRSVAIIGAGLGGLTAALALQRSGWRARVYEQASVLGEVGAGISISAGAAHGLASLGLESALLAASLPVPNVAFAHYQTGELLAGKSDVGVPPDHGINSARHIHRADLHAILLSAVRANDAEAVLTGRRLLQTEQRGERVIAQFADGSSAEADLLIGADGNRSVVRRQWFDDSLPQFAGQVAFRCLVPRAAAAPFMTRGNAAVSVGPTRIFHRYPIRAGSLVNVIGIAKTDQWQEEGWNIPATVAEWLSLYKDFHADVRGLIQCAPAAGLIKWALFVRPPIAQWNLGRIVLLGDAAHPILPFLGLGAALAIEDGVVIARALATTPDVGKALGAYFNARIDRVEAVRLQTLRQGEIIQSDPVDVAALTSAPSQNTNLFNYDPCTVPVYAWSQ
jgi:salicylate hydroxylase